MGLNEQLGGGDASGVEFLVEILILLLANLVVKSIVEKSHPSLASACVCTVPGMCRYRTGTLRTRPSGTLLHMCLLGLQYM